MLVIALGIAALVCSVLIALLSLAGGYPNIHKLLIRLCFPPSKFFTNAIKAIEKLEALEEEGTDPEGEKFRFGTVKQGDKGFDQLAEVLRKNRVLKGEVQEIKLIEEKSGIGTESTVFGPTSPEIVRFLVLIRNGKNEVLQQTPFDPTKSTRELQDWAETIVRKRTTSWIMVLVAIWFAVNTYLVCTR